MEQVARVAGVPSPARQPSVMEKHRAFFGREAVLGNGSKSLGCGVIGIPMWHPYRPIVKSVSILCPQASMPIGWRSEPLRP